MKIINLSDISADWCWLKDEFNQLSWQHFSSQSVNLAQFFPKKQSLKRAIAAWRAVNQAKHGQSLLVSHGPRPAYYGAALAKKISPHLPHLVYSFNFTDLPSSTQRKLMANAFKQPQRFVTYSNVERALYADYFDIPIEKIDMLHWAVHAPDINSFGPPIEAGAYICALGSQGRDYKTLFAAIKTLKQIKLIVVANEASVKDLDIPPNVTVHTNIPLQNAHNILAHSQLMVLPLRDSQVPCGHVTIVSSMFFKKAMVVTDSLGVHDYIKNEETGLFCMPQNPDDLSQKIASLWEDAQLKNNLSESAYAFAQTHCTEKTAINYFSHYLSTIQY